MHGKNAIWMILLLAIAGGLVYWFLGIAGPAPTATLPALATSAPEQPQDSGPRYPLPVESLAEKPNVQPLPALDASDSYLRIDIDRVFGEDFSALLVEQALIERIVATIDNLPRPQVAARIRPVAPLSSQFVALGQDDSGEYWLGSDNYVRYDALVAQLRSVDIEQMVELYRRYYPLFQKAYEGLGYPDAYFNDRLVEVLDHLLQTPDPAGTVALLRPNVLYEYADAELASLSSGQKLLIRMGPAHRAAVQEIIRAFRERVAFGN